ncbi:MAG: sodium:solute symporter family transporter, partial [Gammaproteobacteria bacterium]
MIFSSLDILVIFSYLIGCLFVGLYKSTKIKNLTEYSLGKAQYPSTIMTTTIFATSISSYSTIGTVEKIYNLGFFFIVAFITKPIFFLISGNMLSKNIDKFKGCISITDLFEVLYGKTSKMVVTILSLLMCMGMVAIQVYAVAIILQALGVNNNFGTIISFIVLICYSTLGGIRAVAFTDLFQFIIFFVALPIVCSNGFFEVGGFSGIYQALGKEYFNLNLSIKEWGWFLSILMFNAIPTLGPPIIQRTLMINAPHKMLKIFNTNALLCIPFFLIIAIIGMTIKIKCAASHELEKDIISAFTYGLPNGFVGVVVAGLLAVIMSTADSYLNTASIILTKDVLKNVFKKEKLIHAKLASFILGTCSIPIALKGMNIVDFFWSLSGFWTPIVFVPMVVGYYGLCHTTEKLFWYCAISGVLFSILGFLFFGNLGPTSTIVGVAGSTLAVLIYIFFQPNNKTKALVKKNYNLKNIDDSLLLVMFLIFVSLPALFLFNYEFFKNLIASTIAGSIILIIFNWLFLKSKNLHLGYMFTITATLFLWLFVMYCFLNEKFFFCLALPGTIVMFSFLHGPIEVFLLSVFAAIIILATDNIFLFKDLILKSNTSVLTGYLLMGFFIVLYISRYKSYKTRRKEKLSNLLNKTQTELEVLTKEIRNLTDMKAILEKRIENDRRFFDHMKQHFQKQEIVKLLQHEVQEQIINYLPIIIYGKHKGEEISFNATIKELENLVFWEAKQENTKVKLINKLPQIIHVNINAATMYQILYSFLYNIIAMLKPEAEVNILFHQTELS